MGCVLHSLFCLKYTFQYMCAPLLSLQVKAANGVSADLSSSDQSNAMKGHASTRLVIRPSSTSVSSRRPTFYRQVRLHLQFFECFLKSQRYLGNVKWLIFFLALQPSFTFSYYGRVGSQRYRLRRTTAPLSPGPITTSRSLNDLSDLQRRADRRELQLSASSLSSEGSSSEEGPDRGTTVRLLWLSMLRVKQFGTVIANNTLIMHCNTLKFAVCCS